MTRTQAITVFTHDAAAAQRPSAESVANDISIDELYAEMRARCPHCRAIRVTPGRNAGMAVGQYGTKPRRCQAAISTCAQSNGDSSTLESPFDFP